MSDERSRNAIEVSEQYADRKVGRKVLSAARRAAFAASKDAEGSQPVGGNYTAGNYAAIVALNVCSSPEETSSGGLGQATAGCANSLVFHIEGDDAGWGDRKYQANLLRDIFGNPFRPATVDPDWLTTDVAALARGVYDERVFGAMPILADALQDAGCDNDDILNHCRDSSLTHVRGCWVIDLLTGRA